MDIQVTINRYNRAKIEGKYPITIMRKALSYPIQGARFSPRFKKRGWDGRYHFLTRPGNTFPAGLLHIFIQEFKNHVKERGKKGSIKIIDERVAPEILGKSFDLRNVELRPYQLAAAKAMVKGERGVLKAATNAGKTFVFAAVCSYLRVPTMLIVPGKELLYQAKDDLEKCLGWNVGTIGDGNWKPDFLTVVLWRTLSSRLFGKNDEYKKQAREFLNKQKMVCIDECHTAGSKNLYKMLTACKAYYRFGMSGTPEGRSDNADLKLFAQTGPILYEVSNKQLVDGGFSLKAQVQFIRINQPHIPASCDYQTVYREGITDNKYRNKRIVRIASKFLKKGLQCVVMVQYITHGENIVDLFGDQPDMMYITGKEDTATRQGAIAKFKSGKIRLLITTNILKQGVSIDAIDVIINAAGGKSNISTIQRIGRGLRTGGASNKLYMIDFADMTHEYLIKHSRARLNDYNNEGCFQIKAR